MENFEEEKRDEDLKDFNQIKLENESTK